MRQKAIGVLIVVALVIGVVAVAPAAGAEVSPEGGSSAGSFELGSPGGAPEAGTPGKLITEPIGSIKPGTAAPAVAAAEECGEGDQCVWSGYWEGTLSWWPGSNTGCHGHEGNPNLRSGVNHTPYRTRIGGWGYVAAYAIWYTEGGAVTGEICWPE
jgi:hypothetical protein